MKEKSNTAIQKALKYLSQTANTSKVDKGYQILKELADAGDMKAMAILGYACQFEHIGHYDLGLCREYLERSVEAGNSWGQFYLGEMYFYGQIPFKEDKIYGNSLISKAAKAGNPLAESFMRERYRIVTFEQLAKMM